MAAPQTVYCAPSNPWSMNFYSSENITWSHFWTPHSICESMNLRRAPACFGVIRAILRQCRPWKPMSASVFGGLGMRQCPGIPAFGDLQHHGQPRIVLSWQLDGTGICPWPSDSLLWSVSGTSRGFRGICGSFRVLLTCHSQVWHQFPQMAYWSIRKTQSCCIAPDSAT
jgi:hypothetical protein